MRRHESQVDRAASDGTDKMKAAIKVIELIE